MENELNRSLSSRDWLATTPKKPTGPRVVEAQETKAPEATASPLGIRAVTPSDIPQHWIGPAYQQDLDLLWRFGENN